MTEKKTAGQIRSEAAKKAAVTRKANLRRPGAPPPRPPTRNTSASSSPPAEILESGPAPPGEKPSGDKGESSWGRKAWEEIRGAAEEVSERSSRPPSIVELNRAFSRLASTGTLAAASYFAETDVRLGTDDQIDAAINELRLTETEASQITYPLARAFGRSRFNKRAGREIVDNVEIGESAALLVTISLRWRRYLRARKLADKRAQSIEVAATEVARPPAPQPNPFDQANGHTPPEGGAGILATPGLVEQIRRTPPR